VLNCDIERILAEQGFNTARRSIARTRAHRVNHHRGLWALEFVDRANSNSSQALRQMSDLQVVGRNDQDVAAIELTQRFIAVG